MKVSYEAINLITVDLSSPASPLLATLLKIASYNISLNKPKIIEQAKRSINIFYTYVGKQKHG